MHSENLTLYVTIVLYLLKLVSLFYSYATCQVLCGYLHLNLRNVLEKNISPETNMNRQEEMI